MAKRLSDWSSHEGSNQRLFGTCFRRGLRRSVRLCVRTVSLQQGSLSQTVNTNIVRYVDDVTLIEALTAYWKTSGVFCPDQSLFACTTHL